MAILTTLLSAGALATTCLTIKSSKLNKLVDQFVEYEHNYEIEKLKLETAKQSGDTTADEKIKKLKFEYIEKRKLFEEEKKKIKGKLLSKQEYIQCENCGKETPKTKICAHCGERRVKKEISFCSNCGNQLDNFAKFCSNCGNKIK